MSPLRRPDRHDLPSEPSCEYCAEVRAWTEENAFVRLLGPEYVDLALLIATSTACVMPSVGALTPGHVLVVPRGHHHNVASLTDGSEATGYWSVAARAYAALRGIYGCEVVAFEHGSLGGRTTSGACLDHAHLHMVPLPGGMTPPELPGAAWRSIPSKSLLASSRELLVAASSYLSLWTGRNWWIRTTEGVRPQEMRRVVAAILGQPDRWDWALFPNLDIIRGTIEDFRRGIGDVRPPLPAPAADFAAADPYR